MMDLLALLGIVLAVVGGLAVPIGLVIIIVGALSSEKKTSKFGVRVLLVGSVSLLFSFTLCSVSFKL